jgi:hypothetical protein
MQAEQIKTQSLSPVTDAEAVPESIICERNYEPDGYVPANVARQMEIQLRALLICSTCTSMSWTAKVFNDKQRLQTRC